MIHEMRNYHFEPSKLNAYKASAKDQAMGCLRRKFNVLGFWANTDLKSDVTGPAMDELGSTKSLM